MAIDFSKLKGSLTGQAMIGFADLAEGTNDSNKLSTSKRGGKQRPLKSKLTTSKRGPKGPSGSKLTTAKMGFKLTTSKRGVKLPKV
jgi:hypothetical protein